MKKNISTRKRFLLVFCVDEKAAYIKKSFSFFFAKFTYVNLFMSVLFLHKMPLPQVAIGLSSLALLTISLKSSIMFCYYIKKGKGYFFLVLYDGVIVCSKWNPTTVFYRFALQKKNSMDLLLSH